MVIVVRGIIRGTYSRLCKVDPSISPIIEIEFDSLDEIDEALDLSQWIFTMYVRERRVA